MGFSRTPSLHVVNAAKGLPVTIHRLIDGPLSLDGARAERKAKVEAMAAILLRDGTYADEREAVRSLFGHFPYFEISRLIDDARHLARLDAVAKAMSDR
jgi:hypothetical protein